MSCVWPGRRLLLLPTEEAKEMNDARAQPQVRPAVLACGAAACWAYSAGGVLSAYDLRTWSRSPAAPMASLGPPSSALSCFHSQLVAYHAANSSRLTLPSPSASASSLLTHDLGLPAAFVVGCREGVEETFTLIADAVANGSTRRGCGGAVTTTYRIKLRTVT